MPSDDELLGLGDDVAEALARESAIMSAALWDVCEKCGGPWVPDLAGSRVDWLVMRWHEPWCPR